MGRNMLWFQIVYAVCMLDTTSGILCLSCKSVKHEADCHNVTTCAEGDICYIYRTVSVGSYMENELGCMPKAQCPVTPIWRSGGWSASFFGCCHDGDRCNYDLPELRPTTPPKITHIGPPYITGSTFLKLHSTAELICWSNTSITVSTSWLFNGGSTFPPHAFGNSAATLYIQDMTKSEVGNYTCIISRDGVTANASVFITLIEANTPFGLPKISGNQPITNGKMVLDFHSTASLECASERNDVTFAWQFNGSATLPSHARAMNESLYIGNMNVTEAGKYTCIISKNGLASATSVWVSIKEEKAHIYSVMTSPSYHPRTDDELNIFCRVTGYPEPAILWSFKDPMGLYYMPPYSSYVRPDVLHIQRFQPSVHSGTWTCMARNSLGADQKSIEI